MRRADCENFFEAEFAERSDTSSCTGLRFATVLVHACNVVVDSVNASIVSGRSCIVVTMVSDQTFETSS